MKSYRELEAYIESKRLAIDVHKVTLLLPKFELNEEGSQIRRSSKAVATAIVEGYSRRRYMADFIRFLIYAQAECDETIVHLDFLYETQSWQDKPAYLQLKNDYESLSKRINKFIQWVETNLNDFSKPVSGNQ